MLGTMACRYFRDRGDTVVTTEARFDAHDADAFVRAVEATRPDLTINAIGAIPQKTPASYDVNVALPTALARTACGILVHASTDCVFDGRKARVRCVGDASDATDSYGRTKAAGEAALLGAALVLRASIIGPDGGLMRWFFDQRAATPGYTNHLWTGITTLEWCRIADTRSHNATSRVEQPGIQAITKYALLTRIGAAFNLCARVVPTTAPESCYGRVLVPTIRARPLEVQLAELRSFMARVEPDWRA